MTLYVGLMSGTSLDGMDGVLVDLDGPSQGNDGPPPSFLDPLGEPDVKRQVWGRSVVLRASHHLPFPAALRDELLALNAAGPNELHRAALAANGVAELGTAVVRELLAGLHQPSAQVRAIGSHGQTVRHRPELGYTLQLNNGALLAEHTGIDVVCDFRSRDIAAGGQGAPLVPAFHAEVFGRIGEPRAVLNLGGIANLTLLAGGPVTGFDCGPANVLLDAWAARHLGRPLDDGGRWAASGRVIEPLLSALLAEPFFRLPPPKSTGRDLFHLDWLQRHLQGGEAPADVQATLAELSVRGVVDALQQHAATTQRLLVCGGGAHNTHLLQRLQALLPGVAVETTAAHGLEPTLVEAVAFAWLARAFVERRPGNRAEVTGAAGPRVLGALYPAR
jgi:anhydro-N-acetylmuramic acid kinase